MFLLAAASFLFVPVSCGCMTPAMSVEHYAGLKEGDVTSDISAHGLQARLDSTVKSRTPRDFSSYPLRGNEGCSDDKADEIVCLFPTRKSMVLVRGFRIDYRLDHGRFTSVTVSPDFWF